MSSWRSAGGTSRCTCSGVACWMTVSRFQPAMPYDGRLMPAAANSCSMTSWVPAGDAVRRRWDGGGRELLLDDELLDGGGVAPPRLGPVRRHVTGLDHRV